MQQECEDVIFVVEIVVNDAEGKLAWRPFHFNPFQNAADPHEAIKNLPNKALLRVARYVRVGVSIDPRIT